MRRLGGKSRDGSIGQAQVQDHHLFLTPNFYQVPMIYFNNSAAVLFMICLGGRTSQETYDFQLRFFPRTFTGRVGKHTFAQPHESRSKIGCIT